MTDYRLVNHYCLPTAFPTRTIPRCYHHFYHYLHHHYCLNNSFHHSHDHDCSNDWFSHTYALWFFPPLNTIFTIFRYVTWLIIWEITCQDAALNGLMLTWIGRRKSWLCLGKMGFCIGVSGFWLINFGLILWLSFTKVVASCWCYNCLSCYG